MSRAFMLVLFLTAACSAASPAEQTLSKCRAALPRGDYNKVYACVQTHGYEMAWDRGDCYIFNDLTSSRCLRPTQASN